MIRRAFASLRNRLLLLILLTLLPPSGLVLYTGLERRQAAAAEARAEALRLAQFAAANYQQYVEGARQVLVALARLPEVRGGDPAACGQLLAGLERDYPQYDGFVVAAPDGTVVCHGVPLPGPVNVGERAYFQQALASRDFAVGGFQVNRLSGRPVIHFASPVLDDAGQVQAVVIAALSLAWLNRQLAQPGLFPGAVLVVMDRAGTILAHRPDPDRWVGQRAPEARLVAALLARGEDTVEERDPDGVPRLWGIAALGGQAGGVYIAVGNPVSVAQAAANRMLGRNLAALGLVTLVALAAAWSANDYFVLRPARALGRAAERLAAGDLDARTGLLRGDDEMSRLGSAFDDMAAALQAEQARASQAGAAHRASEAKFRGVLEAAPDAIVTVDQQGRICLVNARAEQVFGYPREQLLGQPVELLVPERLREAHAAHRAAYFAAPRARPLSGNLVARRKDGSEFPVEILLSPIETDEGMMAIAGVHDVSERQRADEALRAREAAEAANRAKSEFLSRMSHELRTPLNAILGFSQLLEMDALTPDQRESVAHILRGGRHLLDLINEVLEISRIETGRLSLSPEPVRVREVLQEVVDLMQPLAADRQVRLLVDAPPDDQGYVLADRQRLTQVLVNVVSNGIKYNREEGTVAVDCVMGTAARLRICVHDTGPGIAPDKLDRLFTPFDRLGAEQSGIEGTGLGLALSRRLAEAMGGMMGVDSAVGEGSTFWVELPVAESPVELFAQLEGAAPAAAGPAALAHGRTVLYVEDNLSNLKLIERLLAQRPATTLLPAMQGSLGLDLARQHHPDLVLLDLHLPDIPGHEVLRRLRDDPATRDIPVIVISADATSGQTERLLAGGARDYLTKPLDVPRFLAVLDEALRQPVGGR